MIDEDCNVSWTLLSAIRTRFVLVRLCRSVADGTTDIVAAESSIIVLLDVMAAVASRSRRSSYK